MAQADQTTIKISKKLRELEKSFVKKLGPQVLDYLFLFTKTDSVQIEFHQLTPKVETEVKQYIELVSKITDSLGLESQLGEGEPLHKQFVASMHDIYLLRYTQAKQQFAEYQIVRVPTRTEQVVLNAMDMPEQADHTVPVAIHFQIPNAFVIDPRGNLNIPETIEAEQRDFQIVSFLSTIPMLPPLKQMLLFDLEDITIFGNVPAILDKELRIVNEVVLQDIIVYLTRRVYAYMKRGMSPIEAKANVSQYYKNITTGGSSDFPPDLAELEEIIEQTLEEELRKIEQIFPQTRQTLIEEYKELLLFYINEGILLPDNYYELRFRDPKDYSKEEKRFNVLFDMYMYADSGELLPLPFETYNIDFTQEARQNIFYAVTGGLENPDFTLQEYLAEVS